MTLDQVVNRMSDFYNKEDLAVYVEFMQRYDIPVYEGIEFLDEHVRADYQLSNGKYEIIGKYMHLVKSHFNR